MTNKTEKQIWGDSKFADRDADERACVLAYLAALPLIEQAEREADETPIDEEWLESVGFARAKHDDMIMYYGNLYTYFIGRWFWRIEAESIPQKMRPQTRGEVRKLFAGLKIPLNEKGPK